MDKKYHVVINYEGSIAFDVEAEDEEAAKAYAESLFEDLPEEELIAGLCDDWFIDAWEE